MKLIKIAAGQAVPWLERYRSLELQCARRMFMTDFLQLLIDDGEALQAVFVEGGWVEVDSTDDLELYRRLWAAGDLGRFWEPTVPTEGQR